jgi:hypothetical protein
VLVVNAAGNPITILSNSPPPVVATLEALKDLDVIYAFLKSGQPKKHKFREAMELPPEVVFKSLAIDTLTEVQVMKNEELSKAAGGAVTRAGNPLQIQEWGESLRFMVHVTRLLYDLDLHVILTAQERIDLGTGRGKTRPFLQGQASDIVPSYAELIGRMTRRKAKKKSGVSEDDDEGAVVTVCHWEAEGRVVVKNQVAPLTLGPFTVEPTVAKVLDAVERQVKRQADE